MAFGTIAVHQDISLLLVVWGVQVYNKNIVKLYWYWNWYAAGNTFEFRYLYR